MKKLVLALMVSWLVLGVLLPMLNLPILTIPCGHALFSSTFEVSHSYDDAHERGTGAFYLTGTQLYIVCGASPNRFHTGLRFPNVTVPKGASITSATVSVYASSETYNDVDCDIYGNDVDDAENFNDNQNILSTTERPRTSASVEWTESDIAVGWHNKTGLASIIQEIVDGDWAYNNAIVLLFITSVESNDKFFLYSYDESSEYRVKLYVTYEGENTVSHDSPSDASTSTTWAVAFDYTVSYYDTPKNTCLRVFNSTDDSLVTTVWNQTALQNHVSINYGSYTFSDEQSYKWDVQYYNASENVFSSASNWTLTIDVPPRLRNQEQNATIVEQGETIELSVEGYDGIGLHKSGLSTNETGSWKNRSCQNKFYFRNVSATHGQQSASDTGTLLATKPISEEQVTCSGWIMFWFDEENVSLKKWVITKLHFYIYWKAVEGVNVTLGYQCNGTYDAIMEVSKKIAVGTGNWELYDDTWDVDIKPPDIYNSYKFIVKLYSLSGYPTIKSAPSTLSYITFEYTEICLLDVADTWTEVEFPWSNSSVPLGRLVQSRMWFNDTYGNINKSDVLSFRIVKKVSETDMYLWNTTDSTLSSIAYKSDILQFTVTASGNSITKIYCGSHGEPTSVTGGVWAYDDTTRVCTVTASHSSSILVSCKWSSGPPWTPYRIHVTVQHVNGTRLSEVEVLVIDDYGNTINKLTSPSGKAMFNVRSGTYLVHATYDGKGYTEPLTVEYDDVEITVSVGEHADADVGKPTWMRPAIFVIVCLVIVLLYVGVKKLR